jgi:hypothetical protein
MIKIGWCSATYIFDAAIEAAYKLQCATLKTVNSDVINFPNPAMIEFAKIIRDELEDGDWDCQQESGFWEELAPYLWPEQCDD